VVLDRGRIAKAAVMPSCWRATAGNARLSRRRTGGATPELPDAAK
jgi:hypothetical protein